VADQASGRPQTLLERLASRNRLRGLSQARATNQIRGAPRAQQDRLIEHLGNCPAGGRGGDGGGGEERSHEGTLAGETCPLRLPRKPCGRGPQAIRAA